MIFNGPAKKTSFAGSAIWTHDLLTYVFLPRHYNFLFRHLHLSDWSILAASTLGTLEQPLKQLICSPEVRHFFRTATAATRTPKTRTSPRSRRSRASSGVGFAAGGGSRSWTSTSGLRTPRAWGRETGEWHCWLVSAIEIVIVTQWEHAPCVHAIFRFTSADAKLGCFYSRPWNLLAYLWLA